MDIKIYAVLFDCKNTDNINSIEDELKRSEGWWNYLDKSWLIFTNEKADDVWKRLERRINKDDTLLTIEVTNNYQGWLPKEAWDWIAVKVLEKRRIKYGNLYK